MVRLADHGVVRPGWTTSATSPAVVDPSAGVGIRSAAYALGAPRDGCALRGGVVSWRPVIHEDLGHSEEASRRASWVLDLVGAGLLTGVLLLVSAQLSAVEDGRALDPLGYVLVSVAGASLGLSRRWPRVVVAVITIVLGCYVGRRYPNGPVFVTGWIALFAVSWETRRRTALLAAGGLCLVLSVVGLVAIGAVSPLPLVFVGWSAAAVFVAEALRNRSRYLAELEARALHLERTREEEALRRVAEDRLRIARDLHDSVAHAMATINVQAGAAAHVVDRRPEAAREALAAIQRASADVLDELAAMLALLREDDEAPDRTPTPGIDQIEQLVRVTGGAQLPVGLLIDGPTGMVPKPVGTAAYRIVQESLTNIVRHAAATSAQVTVRVGGDRSLTVEVCDTGTGATPTSTGTGMGIRGMRERAESTGGRLEAGPRPEGGFMVSASWNSRP